MISLAKGKERRFPGGKMLSRRYRRLQRQHKSAEGKTFWARSCRSVCPRANARMRTYMHTYVYVVLSDGTRGCCGLIYRLSLPWKPRRDRLARHPHIRVDSGLLYSPPRLSLASALALPFPPSPLYTHRSISYSSSLSSILISSTPFAHQPHSVLLSLPDFIPSRRLFSLSSQYTRSMSLFIRYHPEPDPSFSLGLLSVRLLASPNESSSSILSSFHSYVGSFHLVFTFPTLFFYLTILYPTFMLFLLNRIISLAPFRHLSHSLVCHHHSCSFPLSVVLPRIPSSLAIRLSPSLWTSPRPLPPPFPLSSLGKNQYHRTPTPPPRNLPDRPVPDRECALTSYSLPLSLSLSLSPPPSHPLFLPFASTSSLFIYPRLPFLTSFPSPILIFPSICTLRHYRPPSRDRNSLEERQGTECRRNPPQGTAHLRNLPSAMPSITLTAYTIFLLSLGIDT